MNPFPGTTDIHNVDGKKDQQKNNINNINNINGWSFFMGTTPRVEKAKTIMWHHIRIRSFDIVQILGWGERSNCQLICKMAAHYL